MQIFFSIKIYFILLNRLLLYLGSSDDWAKGIAKIKYSYTIELRDTGRHGFILPASQIKISGKEAFAAIKAISKEIQS